VVNAQIVILARQKFLKQGNPLDVLNPIEGVLQILNYSQAEN
jgi:hypothetical protein